MNINEELRNICYSAVYKKYGAQPSKIIISRLEEELVIIEQNNLEISFLLSIKVAQKCKELDSMMISRGSVGGSLVLYLGGVTEVNPLPPHYYCSNCKSVQYVDENKYASGLDLINFHSETRTKCSCCGAELTGDGNNIPHEFLFGHDISGGFDICFAIAYEHKKEITSYIESLRIAVEDLSTEVILHFDTGLIKFDFYSSDIIALIKKLEKSTGIDSKRIKFEEIDIFDFFMEKSYEGIPLIKEDVFRTVAETFMPFDFSDIVKILGLVNGTRTWYDNAEHLAANVCYPQKVISSPDDIMLELIGYGVDRYKAYKIAQIVKNGGCNLSDELVSVMKEHNVPDWYIESMKKIKHLLPKAHLTEWTIILLRLVWYKLYYPVEFDMAVLSVQNI